MRTISLILTAALAGIVLSPGAVAQDLQRGEQLFAVCAACHGPEGAGQPELRAPRIGGLDSEYVAQQLENFRQGTRGHPDSPFANQMRMVALTLEGEGDVTDVAAYVAALPDPLEPEPVAGDAGRGQVEYMLCSACHGPNGEGQPHLNSPRLAGLSDLYLLEQLYAYRAGRRGFDPEDVFGVQMRTMALALRDEQAMVDVVSYIASLDEPPTPETTIEGDAQQGEATFALCAACHGEAARGSRLLNAPRLADQHDWYLLRQLEAFRSGHRGTLPEDIHGQQMRQIALTLPDRQAMADVIAYIIALNAE